MTNLSRIQTLAGLSATDAVVAELKASQATLHEAHEQAIRQAKAGNRIDEGLWKAVLGAMSTAGQATIMGAKAIAFKAKNLSESLKQLYIEDTPKSELGALLSLTESTLDALDQMEADAPNIIRRDKDIGNAVGAFKSSLQSFVGTLMTRTASIQATESKQVIDETNVGQLCEEFHAPLNKAAWIAKHLSDINFEKHRPAIEHVLAARCSMSDLKKLKEIHLIDQEASANKKELHAKGSEPAKAKAEPAKK